MRLNMSAAQDNVEPDTENVKGLNLEAVKIMTVQVTKLLL
jgi:Cu/Ag efflux protein CusF